MQVNLRNNRFLAFAVSLWCAVIVMLLILQLIGCRTQEKINADIWTVEPKDGTIQRIIEVPGEPIQREFLFCTDPSAAIFKCVTDEDLKKWTDRLARCQCPEF